MRWKESWDDHTSDVVVLTPSLRGPPGKDDSTEGSESEHRGVEVNVSNGDTVVRVIKISGEQNSDIKARCDREEQSETTMDWCVSPIAWTLAGSVTSNNKAWRFHMNGTTLD